MTHHHNTIALSDFELIDTDQGAGDALALEADETGDWLPAVVPGGVHESLLAAGRIEHPYYGDNERKAAWIEDRDWWYRTRFARPAGLDDGARARLVFDGLDTVADVWLNGRLLGHHENQFRPAEFDVTDALGEANTVLVRFAPPLAGRTVPPTVAEELGRLAAAFGALGADEAGGEAADAAAESSMLTTLPLATTLRKAAFSWGWDFGPNVPSLGIWRPVRLSVERRAVITGHHIALASLSADRSSAVVRVGLETDAAAPGAYTARLRLAAPSGRVVEAGFELGADGGGSTELVIEDPELWWTHDLGEQALHEASVELREGDVVVDAVIDRIGLRTIELDRGTPAARRFQFRLNGVPVFARGAAWLPASTMVGSVTAETYRDRVLRAREGNLNMLRVWGGGIYEHDAFYAVCDELGMLVWQDFMFACIDYPDAEPALRREVELEAAYQVRRLRNRASLALWCGNNEVQVLHLAAYQSVEPGDWGWHFFHEVLPAAVTAHDGLTPYWPGSPYGEGRGILSINGTDDGDRHTWEVWHGMVIPGMTIGPDEYPSIGDARHYRRYAYDTARFVSEFGIHAAPEIATLRRWLPDAGLEVHSSVFDLHNKDTPKNKGDELLSVTTGLPEGLEQYVAFTQAVQAEGMAFGIEHYRRRQPETAGALMWQFNDVWPGFSWSVVDYDGVPKAAYYAAKRASAPVTVSFADTEDGGLELWLVNNSRDAVELDVDVELGAFDGGERTTRRVRGSAGSAESARVLTIAAGEVPRDAAHYAWASSPDGAFPAARRHFAEIGRLELPVPQLAVSVVPGGLRIRATGYAYQVRIEQPAPGIRLSDNCFDLRDGDERDIAVDGADPAALSVTGSPVGSRTRL
ncbi:MAG TPA: hypothetical protein VGC45_09580 [Gryllotalpicola sp.]